jgi:hypothetical protein
VAVNAVICVELETFTNEKGIDMKQILFLVLIALSSFVTADDIAVTITPPILWNNGDTVLPSDIANYHLVRDCAGDIEEVYTDQLTHVFANAPDGDCTITGAAIGQNGKAGELTSVSVTTGLILGVPGINATAESGTSLSAIIAACAANPICTSVIATP